MWFLFIFIFIFFTTINGDAMGIFTLSVCVCGGDRGEREGKGEKGK